MTQNDRGVSTVLGVALMVGLVAVTSVALLLVAVDTTADTERQLERERVEQSFIELSHTIATQAGDSDGVRSVEFEAGDRGAITREATGKMVVNSTSFDDVEFTLGTIEWEDDDGTTVAFQAGAVFREKGPETQLLSAPAIQYDVKTEELEMPIYTVTGDERLHSGQIEISQRDLSSVNEVARIDEHNVSIYVESEYHRGWKQYFEEQAGDTVVRSHGPLPGHDDLGYVEVELGYKEFEDALSDGVSYTGACEGQGSHDCEWHDEDISEGGPYEPMDAVIDKMINDPVEATGNDFDEVINESDPDPDFNFTDEYVLIDRDLDGEFVNVDLSAGNATLAVNGDIKQTDIRVTNVADNNTLQLFVNGSYQSDGQDVCVVDCDSLDNGSTIQMFGTSDMSIHFGPGGDPNYEGVLYAASNEDRWEHLEPDGVCSEDSPYQMCVQATPDVYGSVIVESINIQGDLNITHADGLSEDDIDFHQHLLPPQLTYMNMVEYTLAVENE